MAIELINRAADLKKAEKVFRAINHPLRKKILALLDEKQQVRVTDIYVHLRLEQSVASLHLKILRKAKIVKTERRGKCIMYMPDYDTILNLQEVTSIINNMNVSL